MWLQQDHVKKYWQESENLKEFEEKFLVKLPSRKIKAFIILLNGVEIGYIQYYDATKVGGGWWENEKQGTFGVDILIGEKNKTGQGVGRVVINSFINLILEKEDCVKMIIIDPEPENVIAIKAFQKAGFEKDSIINTPNGEAVLMRKVIQ